MQNNTSIESILLTVAYISTFKKNQKLTTASGFYFQRDDSLFLITNRHVVHDSSTQHEPDRLEITLHVNEKNIVETSNYSIPLYDKAGFSVWLEATDDAGTVDVIAIPIDSRAFPTNTQFAAFSAEDLPGNLEVIEVGASVRVVGFPMAFKDELHNLPIMRHAIIASSFSLRFQGLGYFLTDSLLHRGSSGSPVVLRTSQRRSGRQDFPWVLLGVHSSRLDSANQEVGQDERLNLFTAWYSDVIMTLTDV